MGVHLPPQSYDPLASVVDRGINAGSPVCGHFSPQRHDGHDERFIDVKARLFRAPLRAIKTDQFAVFDRCRWLYFSNISIVVSLS
jgi:hypothetical protein